MANDAITTGTKSGIVNSTASSEGSRPLVKRR